MKRKAETSQHALGVRQIADNFTNGQRLYPHERRQCDDLVGTRDLRVLHQIDEFDIVLSREMLFADLPKIAESDE